MARDLRQSSERLGYLMNSPPYERQTNDLKDHLREFEHTAGQPAERLINHPIQRYNGRTPVHLAATNGLWECLEILLKNGGDPNSISSATDLCQTPLHLAATKGYAKCLQILLEYGAKLDIENNHRVTALDLVRGKKNSEKVVQHAIAKFQIPSRTREQQQKVMELHELVEDGEDFELFYRQYDSLPPDHMDLAARWTDWYQQTLLYRACTVESIDVVRFMLSKSKNQPLHNLNSEDTPLLVTCKKSNHEIASLLLNHSPRLLFLQDAQGKLSPLHVACSRGDSKMVELILEHMGRLVKDEEFTENNPLSLDFRDNLGRTPLFNACYYGFTGIVRLLVEFQSQHCKAVTLNVNAAVKQTQRTPLHAAVRKGNMDLVKILLSMKDIKVNSEARPSGKTHQRLIRTLQRKLHGRVLPAQDSVDEERATSPENLGRISIPPNTPTTITPLLSASTPTSSLLSPSSSSLGMAEEEVGFNMRSPRTPELNRHAFTFQRSPPASGVELVSRVQRSATEAPNLQIGEASIGIFENDQGGLDVLPLQQGPKNRSFDHLFMTPLTEACVYGFSDVIDLLLKHGAQDDSGLACRVAHLIQKPLLEQLILTHHCVLTERKGELRKPLEVKKTVGMQLHWGSKRLYAIQGEWFTENVKFYPPRRHEDEDNMGYHSSLRLNHQRASRLRPPSIAEVDISLIRVVHLEQNNLESVPLELFCLPNIAELDLSYNKLTRLPEVETDTLHALDLRGWRCSELEELNLNHNLLVKMPSCVWVLPVLKKLFVNHNNLESLLPDRGREIQEEMLSETLEILEFSHNQLKVLPRFIFEFSSLKKVNLHKNNLEMLPDTLWNCPSLQELIISNNQLASLPWCEPEHTMIASRLEAGTGPPDLIRQSERALMGKFEVRPKYNRQASAFARQTSQVTLQAIRPIGGLQELSWSNLSAAGTEASEYSSLYKLNLSNNKLEMFPEALPCLAPNLTELDVSDNTFRQVDIQFIPQSMKKLTARRCKIERFGNVIKTDLYAQVVKNCRHGRTFGLPCQHRSHIRLPCLTQLFLSGNRLEYFQLIHHAPVESDEEDPAMEEMRFRSNVSSLDLLYPALEGLDLGANNLQQEFNPNIGHQSHLKWIHLRKNVELLKIPMEFAYLKNTRQFTELSMDDLPNLFEPPREYQSVSLNHLLTYMRSRLKESVYHRTIKLFLIGCGERGKTTLLRRLRGMPDERTERTTGIDIEDWVFPEQRRFSFKTPRNPVTFLTWDFAGQDVYHTTHQCFYSRRSLYLALFRLTDGMAGVNELEPWLRTVQLRAPGCPVIIVGTHLDCITEPKAKDLEKAAMEKYNDQAVYPKVVLVTSVSSTRRASVFFNNNMDKLRNRIYEIACHLQLSTDGTTLEFKPSMMEDDPKALFQQQIPKSFLDLQGAIRQAVATYHQKGAAPIMVEGEFKKTFREIFEDDDELNEAVYCLNLQGTLLHFEDHGLKSVYFLDPQWLAKLMASVIHPSATNAESPIKNGVGEVSQLFVQNEIPHELKEKYIQLLEKFEVALKINRRHVIIPSLMPPTAIYPKTNDVLTDVCNSLSSTHIDPYYQPALRRFWLSDYIPDGFWPRLICRIATDQQIGKLLRTVIGDDPHLSSMENSTEGEIRDRDILNWNPWKTGIAFSHRGRTLLVVKQEDNRHETTRFNLKWLEGAYRVEVHVYTPEWITLGNELLSCDRPHYTLDSPYCLPGLATQLLVMISQHVKSLASNWFPGMLICHATKFNTYMPCWKCFAEIGTAQWFQNPGKLPGIYIIKNKNPVHCFHFEDSIVPVARQNDLECPLHGKIRVMHVAPDLIFWDLQQSFGYQDHSAQLVLCEDEVLGKGGYGFVCKGELTLERGPKRNVAVKVFLHEIEGLVDQYSISELLDLSKQPKHLLYAYREIRQEVAFLATLKHPNLTMLCGVRTHPFLCLLLELAPKKSLRTMLKEYKECHGVLEPLTLKTACMQIASGLDYLHRNQVVHLDMKSPNVLVWHFPSPYDSRQTRVRQAGNVWLKLADYGISQVSTGLTLRVGNSPVGTPGFMAPELFEHAGQDVSSEKVDVFAFGMTMYELLSQKSPFEHVLPLAKRNREVRDKQRPFLRAKETRSLVLLQDLMVMCWDQEPDERPRMKQVKQWVSAPEFERLRAEISLKEVKSISCSCVCRILPENEEEFPNQANGQPPEDEVFYDIEDSFSPLMGDLDLNDFGSNFSGPGLSSIGGRAILPSVSEDSFHIEYGDGGEEDEGEERYQFIHIDNQQPAVEAERAEGGHQILEPYTQVWLCGRDQRKGLLQIFTWYDGQAGSYAFSGYCSKEEVSALCAVRNTMWMGTSTGTLKVFHAPTLKAKFAGKLELGGTKASAVLDILHVEESSSVLVATFGGEIWSFCDHIVQGGLRIEETILLPDCNPCYHLVKVNVQGSVEVWGTMDNNRVLLLEKSGSGWTKLEYKSDPKDLKLQLCSYIAHACFTGKDGTTENHIWISYRNRSVLVCWDAKTRHQRCILNCATELRNEEDMTFQVATLTAQGRKVIIGTTGGTVGIFDSETLRLLNSFHWHKGKVRSLLVMPKEMEPCICAEIPFPKKEEEWGGPGEENTRVHTQQIHTQRITRRLQPPTQSHRPGAAFSYMNNLLFVPNPEPEAVIITSIGNGRKRFIVNEPSKEEKVMIFDRAALNVPNRRTYRNMLPAKTAEDVFLLTWRS